LSSARSNDHLCEPNVHIIALKIKIYMIQLKLIEPSFYQSLSSTNHSFPFGKFHAHLAYLMFVVVKIFCLKTIFNSIINCPLCQLKGETISGCMNYLHWNFEFPPLRCMRVTSLYSPLLGSREYHTCFILVQHKVGMWKQPHVISSCKGHARKLRHKGTTYLRYKIFMCYKIGLYSRLNSSVRLI